MSEPTTTPNPYEDLLGPATEAVKAEGKLYTDLECRLRAIRRRLVDEEARLSRVEEQASELVRLGGEAAVDKKAGYWEGYRKSLQARRFEAESIRDLVASIKEQIPRLEAELVHSERTLEQRLLTFLASKKGMAEERMAEVFSGVIRERDQFLDVAGRAFRVYGLTLPQGQCQNLVPRVTHPRCVACTIRGLSVDERIKAMQTQTATA